MINFYFLIYKPEVFMKKVRLFFPFLLALWLAPILSSAQITCSDIQGKDALPIERDCYRYDFPYFLKYNGSTTPAPTSFQTCRLFIEGHLAGASAAINDNLTLSMLHPNLYDGQFTITGNNFQYEYNGNATELIDVPIGSTNILFTIVGEGFPGSTLDVVVTRVEFIEACSPVNCILSTPGTQLIHAPPKDLLDAPPCTNPDWEIALGTETIEGDLVKIPVLLKSTNGISLSEIDFKMDVSDLYGNIQLLEPETVGSNNSMMGTITFDGQSIYFHEVSFSSGPLFYPDDFKLFEIWVTAPTGNTVTVDFDFARVKDYYTDECCSPVANTQTVTIPGDPPCIVNDVVFIIGKPAYTDCQVRFPVLLDLTEESFNMTTMLIELDVELAGGATLNVAETEASVETQICPGSCLIYPGLGNDCVSVSGNTVSYGFCTPNTTVPTEIPLFWIVVDGEPGDCVNSISYTSAQVSMPGETCQPTTIDKTDKACINGIEGGVKSCCSGDPIPDVTISMSPDNAICDPEQAITDSDGNYSECVCPEDGVTYQVTPTKDGDDICGVSTLDLVIIQRHILGLAPFTDPCDIIAADVNCDGQVTPADLIEIRKLVLGITVEFEDCDSWVFVDSDHTFPNPSNPFGFPESVDVTLPDKEANFTGIKKGDVTCNCEETTTTTSGNGVITMEDRSMTSGEEVWVEVKGEGLSPVLAYQFGLEFDPTVLELTDVSVGDVPHFSTDNFSISNGSLTTSWISGAGITGEIADGDVLFRIKVKANLNVLALSNTISLTTTRTPAALGYGAQGEAYALTLAFRPSGGKGRSGSVSTPSLAAHLHPNPVVGNLLQVNFDLPEAGAVRLQIYDVLGKVVYSNEETRRAGVQQMQITGIDGWSSGIYTYSLSIKGLRQSGKIVVQ